MPLPEQLSPLLHEQAYPHPCGPIRLIETHISWVILTGEFAYKLKKPVQFNFVDFSTLALREHFCREEVRCNRAFAPALYLGVVALVVSEHGISVRSDPVGEERTEVLEWAVQMCQFEPEQGLDRLLARGELSGLELRDFGVSLATLHGSLPVLDGHAAEVPERIFGPVVDNFAEIGRTALADRDTELFRSARSLAAQWGERLRPEFEARITGGSVRECHGDLHLSNLALIDGVVTAFDCLEFNENLRWIDTMSDVAFLFMDCHCRDEVELAYRFLDGYLGESGDYQGVALLHYFAAYRSVVRAKVAALRWVQAQDAEGEAKFFEHLQWAREWLSRGTGTLILTCGLSGSGKSYLASRLLGALPAIRLRSDVARKRLHGLDVHADSGSPVDGGLYGAAQSERTFEHLAAVARQLLLAGEHVIVDATFIERDRRRQFQQLASGLGASAKVLYCDAPIAVLEDRLARRAQSGADPSEATSDVLALQQTRFDAFEAEEAVLRVDTAVELDATGVSALVSAILPG